MIIYEPSKTDFWKARSFPAVGILSKVLGIDAFEQTEVFVNLDAFFEIVSHLFAFGNLVWSQQSIVVQALDEGPFVGQAGQLLVGLIFGIVTLY